MIRRDLTNNTIKTVIDELSNKCGQKGQNANQYFVTNNFIEQIRQVKRNIAKISEATGAKPEDFIRLSLFTIDNKLNCNIKRKSVKLTTKSSKTLSTMTILDVTERIEDQALVEINAMAHFN